MHPRSELCPAARSERCSGSRPRRRLPSVQRVRRILLQWRRTESHVRGNGWYEYVYCAALFFVSLRSSLQSRVLVTQHSVHSATLDSQAGTVDGTLVKGRHTLGKEGKGKRKGRGEEKKDRGKGRTKRDKTTPVSSFPLPSLKGTGRRIRSGWEVREGR